MMLTKKYQVSDFQDEIIIQLIKDVSNLLEEKGYDSVKQLVGYLISGDPGYITSYKGARNLITKYERDKVLGVLVKQILK